MNKILIMIFMLCIALPALAAEFKVSCTGKTREGESKIEVITIDEPKILVQKRRAAGQLEFQEECPYPPIAPYCMSYSLTLSEFVEEFDSNQYENEKNADDGYKRDVGYRTTISRIDGSYKKEYIYLMLNRKGKRDEILETGTCVPFKQVF